MAKRTLCRPILRQSNLKIKEEQGEPNGQPRCPQSAQSPCCQPTQAALRPSHSQQRRADVRTLVDAGFNVAWAGDGDKPQGVASIPWTHPDYLPALMSRAAVTLCVDLRHDVAGYWSDRLWLALGAGACVVRRFTEGQPGLPYLSYTHRQ